MKFSSYAIKSSLKPREKLTQFGVSSLTEHELISSIVGSGIPGKPIEVLSEEILEVLLSDPGEIPSVERLSDIHGVGAARSSQMISSLELARRVLYPSRGYQLESPKAVYDLVKLYAYCPQEQVLVLTVSGQRELIRCRVVFKGTFNSTVVHPREVFIDALQDHAAGVIVVHNHPSGSLAPSVKDREFTQALNQSGEMLGIPLMDHVIISREGYYSFSENMLLV